MNASQKNNKTTKKHVNSKKYSPSNPALKSNKVYMIPLILVMAVLPLIMYLHTYDSFLSKYNWFSYNTTQIDIFLYYKQLFFIIICSLMLIIILYKVFICRLHKKFLSVFIPLFIYGFIAFLSTLFSEYPSYGFKGIFEQFESIFVILGYCLLVYYAFLFIETEDDINFLFKYFIIGILILIILGVLQATGNDLFATDFGKKLYLPRIYWNDLDNVSLSFEANRVYMTLYNPNYVGVYVSLVLPIIIGLLVTEKRKKSILLYIIILTGLIICLLGSKSKAGLIGLIISLICIAIFFRKYIFYHKKVIVPIIGIGLVTLIIFIGINFNAFTIFIKNITQINKSNFPLQNIKTDEDLTLTYYGNDITIDLTENNSNISLSIKDANGKDIPYTNNTENGMYVISDERFSGIQVAPYYIDNIFCVQVNVQGVDWIFTNQLDDNTYYYLNYLGKFDKIVKADSSLFTGYESFASGRGYIWSRTIPLLNDNIFLGSGADTFALEFPQQDYVDKHYSGFDGQIITKPHSMYLQIGVQSGVISLIAFIIFYLIYFVFSIKLYIKGNFNNLFKQVGVSIFIGTIGYMITGITNDSTITVAPIAWALIGIGIACNYKVKEQIKNDIIEN